MLDQLRRTRKVRSLFAFVVLALGLTTGLTSAHAASPVSLGTADSFALLAGSTITNTGSTTITGDIGLCCTGLAFTGSGSVTQPSGAVYIGPGTPAETAQADLDVAYADAAGRAVTNTVPVDLSLSGTPANPLPPGVYESTAHGAFQINTGLTLDFQGDPNAVFIFQGTTLTTAAGPGGSVSIVNGGASPSACNIYWQLSDATQGVTLGTDSAFKGTTMALGASVLGTGATVEGRILTRRSKAVNLDTNTITRTACAAATSTDGGGGTAPTAPPSDTTATTPASETAATPPPSETAATTPPSETTATTPTSDTAAPTPALSGSARLWGPRRPVSSPFRVWVTGRAIRKVIFYIDGRRVGTSHAKQGRTKFILNINPRRQSRRVHRVTARVFFKSSSRTRSATRRLTYRRASAARQPRFTG